MSELRPGFGKVFVLLATQEPAICCADKEARWLLNHSLKKYPTAALFYIGFLVILRILLYAC